MARGCFQEGESWVLRPNGFLLGQGSGKDLLIIVSSFPGVSFQGYGLLGPVGWPEGGERPPFNAAGLRSAVAGFVAFLILELKRG